MALAVHRKKCVKEYFAVVTEPVNVDSSASSAISLVGEIDFLV